MRTGIRRGVCVLGLVCLGMLMDGCGGTPPPKAPSDARIQKDTDRFFDTLEQEERRREAAPAAPR